MLERFDRDILLRTETPDQVIHVLSGLAIGGKEAAALRLAQRGVSEGALHRLLLFDTPFRSRELDFEPANVPTDFARRRSGLDWGFTFALSRYLSDHQPQAVHAYNDTAIFYVALAQLLRRGTYRTIGTFHAWPSHPTRNARRASYWACRRFHSINAVSGDLRDRLKKYRWTNNCDVISNGVDLTKFSTGASTHDWRSQLGVPNGAILVGNIARFDEIKRQKDLVEAAKLLERTNAKIVIVLVGQGQTLEATRRLAQDCRNIRFVEQIADVPSFLRSIDIFTLCSEYEAAPLVILEAMACSLPIVATEVGGVPSIVEAHARNTCAITLPLGRPDLLAGALAKLEACPHLRIRLGSNARAIAGRHSFDREWKAYQALYQRVARSY
jgi:glycosyltransferase involved in cell wall biosynthesis